MRKLVEFKDLVKLNNKIHKSGQKVVFTTGSFELITPGHCRFLAEAKSLGDILVVGLCTDRSITKTKGNDYPLLNQSARGEMLSYLRSVDHITLMDEGEPHTSIVLLEPDVFFTSPKELENGNIDEQAKFLLKRHGGKLVIRRDDNPYKSARDLIEHVADIRFLEIVANYLWSKKIDFNLDNVANFKPADYGDQKPCYSKAFDPADRIFTDITKLKEHFTRYSSKKIVFVSGSYDLLHVGHARFVQKASKLGDVLVVGIPSDQKIRAQKGYGRPIINAYSRAYVLASLAFVDYVFIFDDETVAPTLEALRPNVFFTVDEGWNKGLRNSREYKIVKDYRGKVVVQPRQSPYLSSSVMINKIANKKVKEIFAECLQDEKFASLLLEGRTKDDKKY